MLVSTQATTGVLELNRPKALNSLNPEMIDILDEAIKKWQDDPAIHRVVLSSTSPKGFCAGGDVRFARDCALAGDHQPSDHFFATEYIFNGDLAEFAKPFISLIDGVVMGGGLGVSAHGSHRVITERAFAAMPEMVIAYIPDVGIPYMFQHMVTARGRSSYALAVFLVVTGWRMSPADMLFAGLATDFVPSEKLEEFTEMLIAESLDEALATYSEQGPRDSELEKIFDDIEACFNFPTWEEISQALDQHPNQEFTASVQELIKDANPTSVVGAVELMAAVSKCANIRESLALETKIGEYYRRDPNFAEGVRAVLVDKDRQSTFHPANYEDVDVEAIRRRIRPH